MGILDTPARNQRQQYNAFMSFRERCNIEGRPFNSGSDTTNGTYTTDGSIAGGFGTAGLTRAWALDTITITCNKNARLQITVYETGIGGNDAMMWRVQSSPGVPIIIPVNAIVRPSVTAFNAGSSGSVRIREVYDADKTGVNLNVWASGWTLTDDLDYGAEKVYLHIGDSITGPGTGITNKSKQYDWQLLNYLQGKGHSLRMLNTSVSGSASALHESRRSLGAYNFAQADLIGYSLGMNDAGQAVPTATYKTNVKNMIAWKQARYPNATMIVFGATPAENNTTETALALLRTAASEAVAEANDNKVKYCNLGTAFDRTVSSNYAGTDTAGSRVHPNDAGHAAVFNVVKTFVDNNNIRP